MKVILVNGSPHENGCTYAALSEVEDTLRDNGISTEIFWIGNKPIQGCTGCGACGKMGRCCVSDTVNEFITLAAEAQGFVFGTPVHYAAASGAMTSFMDRAFYSGGKVLIGKPAAAVVSCRRGGASAAFDQMNKYFTINCMPIVSSQYWNQVHGNAHDDVLKDEEGLQTMRTLGNNMAWLIKCIAAGHDVGVDFPQREPVIRTNFIR